MIQCFDSHNTLAFGRCYSFEHYIKNELLTKALQHILTIKTSFFTTFSLSICFLGEPFTVTSVSKMLIFNRLTPETRFYMCLKTGFIKIFSLAHWIFQQDNRCTSKTSFYKRLKTRFFRIFSLANGIFNRTTNVLPKQVSTKGSKQDISGYSSSLIGFFKRTTNVLPKQVST